MWFLQESREPFTGESAHSLNLVVPAAEDDPNVWLDGAEFPERFFPAHNRHGHVEQDDSRLTGRACGAFPGTGRTLPFRHSPRFELIRWVPPSGDRIHVPF